MTTCSPALAWFTPPVRRCPAGLLPLTCLRTTGLFGLLFAGALAIGQSPRILVTDALIEQTGQRYGREAQNAVVEWRQLLDGTRNLPEQEKLESVNQYFNRKVAFTSDDKHWQQEDYWATPLETLGTAAGDCEDFVIAKYFSLIQLGVDQQKLRITYVKALSLNQAHMVLAYYPSPKAEPLILDNLMNPIKPASRRSDLSPVYSFNGAGMWLERKKGGSIKVGDPNRLSMWSDLVTRMKEQGLSPFLELP